MARKLFSCCYYFNFFSLFLFFLFFFVFRICSFHCLHLASEQNANTPSSPPSHQQREEEMAFVFVFMCACVFGSVTHITKITKRSSKSVNREANNKRRKNYNNNNENLSIQYKLFAFRRLSPLFESSFHHAISSDTHTSSYYRIITQIYIFLHALRALEVFSGIFLRVPLLCLIFSPLCALLSHGSYYHPNHFHRSFAVSLHSHFVWKSFSYSLMFFLASCCSLSLPNSKHFFRFSLVFGKTRRLLLCCVTWLGLQHTKLAISISKNDSNENYKRKSQL